MSTEIAGDLEKLLQEAEPDQEIPVLVTVAKDADLTALEQQGLKIERRFESIPVVAGKLTASNVRGFAQLDPVERIEYDGKVWAQTPE